MFVVRVVRDFVVRVPQKVHTPLTVTVDSGLLGSAESPITLRQFAKWQVGELAF